MALKAKLKLDGKEYNVQDLDYEISQSYSNNYKPSGYPVAGLIRFTILSPMSTNYTFHEWVLKTVNLKDGEFSLPLTDGIDHIVKTISFQKANCISLHEYYSNTNSKQMYMRIAIVAPIISFGDGGPEYRNKELPK